MSVTFKGGTGAMLVPPGSRLRVTWRWVLADYLNPLLGAGFDAPGIALKIRDALPGVGYIAVSLPSAASGDEVVVYDVKVGSSSGTRTLADHAARLNDTPVSSLLGGRIVEVTVVELVYLVQSTPDGNGVQLVGPNGGPSPSSAEIQESLSESRDEAQADASAANVIDSVKSNVKDALDRIGLPLGIAAGLVGVAALLYFLPKRG